MSNPRSKTQKKLDKQIRMALTKVCENALEVVPGFEWLTHQADYANFPASLLITCVFATHEDAQQAQANGQSQVMAKHIQAELLRIGVVLKSLNQQIMFDSEQACAEEHGACWAARLASRKGRTVPKGRPGP